MGNRTEGNEQVVSVAGAKQMLANASTPANRKLELRYLLEHIDSGEAGAAEVIEEACRQIVALPFEFLDVFILWLVIFFSKSRELQEKAKALKTKICPVTA